MLERLQFLATRLNESGISWCHWKSTTAIDAALGGADDADLLVPEKHRPAFEAVIQSLGFHEVSHRWAHPRGIRHYLGMDMQARTLIHLHVYYGVITGGSILKAYALPLENYFLADAIPGPGGMPLARPEKDLAGLVLRRMLAHASLIEYAMLRREGLDHFYDEYDRLASQPRIRERAIESLCTALPALEPRLVAACFDVIARRKGFLARYAAARRLQAALARYALYPAFILPLMRTYVLCQKLVLRAIFGRLKFYVRPRGMMMAVTGSDASGKSTLVQSIAGRLKVHIAVVQRHAGLPPATGLTFPLRTLLPLARKLMPGAKTTNLESDMHAQKTVTGFRAYVFALRSLTIAWDRLNLLRHLAREADRGTIIILDRYPCLVQGAPDSPQINAARMNIRPGTLLSAAQRLERRLYEKMPAADLVIRLRLPLAVALERNAARIKKGNESADYVTRRHAACELQDFSFCRATVSLDAVQPAETVLNQALDALWHHL